MICGLMLSKTDEEEKRMNLNQDAISMTETVINVAMNGCKKRARDNK